MKAVVLTSESTDSQQIADVRSAFGAPVHLQYGHSEASVFAYTVDDSYVYQYKGYTRPEARGLRLHAIGMAILVGASFGLIKSARSLSEVENGKVRFALPTIIPEFQETSSGGQSLALKAELFRGRF